MTTTSAMTTATDRDVEQLSAGLAEAFRAGVPRRAQVYSGLDMLTVLTIDMDRGLPEVDSDAVMTGAELVYASPRRLYVATQRFVPQSVPEEDLQGGTTIHEFDASDSGERSRGWS